MDVLSLEPIVFLSGRNAAVAVVQRLKTFFGEVATRANRNCVGFWQFVVRLADLL